MDWAAEEEHALDEVLAFDWLVEDLLAGYPSRRSISDLVAACRELGRRSDLPRLSAKRPRCGQSIC